MNKKVYIILGSIRENRNGQKVFDWVNKVSKNYREIDFDPIDLKDWDLPMFKEGNSPKNGEYTNPIQVKWSEKITKADGFIIISPEYNHGYSSVLKNALDYLYKEWNNKPVAFIGYGATAGGSRSNQHLKQVVLELKMKPLYSEVLIHNVWDAFDESGIPKNEHLNVSLDRLFKEMLEKLT